MESRVKSPIATWHRILCLITLLPCFLQYASALSYNSTALVIGTTQDSGSDFYYLLDGYGIGYKTIILSKAGQDLPSLETNDVGSFGLFAIVNQAMVGGQSFLTNDQWNSLYAYQEKYSVRMVHFDAIPSTTFGVTALDQCCDDDVEQYMSIVGDVASKEFPEAGLRVANLSTLGLYHAPAKINSENSSTTTTFLEFLPNANYNDTTVAGVINSFGTREQMAFFTTSGNWSSTSAYFNHIWVQWGYRGFYQGYRRIFMNTQVDDLFLSTTTYDSTRAFRVRSGDLAHHIEWSHNITKDINRTNPGSNYFAEFGFNANGNLAIDYGIYESNNTGLTCSPPLFTSWEEPDTGLEYQKPLGTGKNSWPANPTFDWSGSCILLDALAEWFMNTSNRDSFGLVSHTFTHLDLDRATYHDVLREISFNLLFAELMNFTNAQKFSGSGLIPPAITGMHNGDALRAFSDNGLWNAIGDNTRAVLRSNQNFHWPRLTDMQINGYLGYQITPRFATRIYYNCDTMDCDLQQCIETADCPKNGGMDGLLALEKKFVPNQLLSLFHDPYMFHQPNLRQIDVDSFTVNGNTQQFSLLGLWVQTVTDELRRLVDWPITSLKHDHIAQDFNRRLTRDACNPSIKYNLGTSKNGTMGITSITVQADGGRVSGSLSGNVTITNHPKYINTCAVQIPVTIPLGSSISTAQKATSSNITDVVDVEIDDGASFRVEQIGNDPQTIWVLLNGKPVVLNIDTTGNTTTPT